MTMNRQELMLLSSSRCRCNKCRAKWSSRSRPVGVRNTMSLRNRDRQSKFSRGRVRSKRSRSSIAMPDNSRRCKKLSMRTTRGTTKKRDKVAIRMTVSFLCGGRLICNQLSQLYSRMSKHHQVTLPLEPRSSSEIRSLMPTLLDKRP